MERLRTFTLLAVLCTAACSRNETPQPAVPAPATPAAAPVPAPSPAPASTPASAPIGQAVKPDLGALSRQVWQVTASGTVAAGSLYVFLADGTLLVATPGSTLARGRWRGEGEGLVMVEDSIAYPVDVLEQQPGRLRLRSHNPGAPVDFTLAAVAEGSQQVPQPMRGEWAGSREDCARPGSETRLRLQAGSVRFNESSGPVLAAVADPRDARQVDLVARLAGEGSVRLAWRRFRLAPDGASLLDVTEGPRGGLARVRCS